MKISERFELCVILALYSIVDAVLWYMDMDGLILRPLLASFISFILYPSLKAYFFWTIDGLGDFLEYLYDEFLDR